MTLPRVSALLDYWSQRSPGPPARPGRAMLTERVPGLATAGRLPDWAKG